MAKGQLIVIEGSGDGVGKSTQCNLLKQKIKQENKEYYFHHFPSYGTYQGSLVEHYLKGNLGSPKDISPYLINSLYAIDRAITWNKDLKCKYDQGSILLLDRYTTSSLIYQAALLDSVSEKKAFVDYVLDFEYNKIGIQPPDNVIFLHVPFELSKKLRNQRTSNEGIDNDIHERNIKLMEKIYENSLFIANYLNWDFVECSNGNEMKTKEEN